MFEFVLLLATLFNAETGDVKITVKALPTMADCEIVKFFDAANAVGEYRAKCIPTQALLENQV